MKPILPILFTAKNVRDWDDLEKQRAQHAPILGLDGWWEVAKYCMADLVFCGLVSKAFVWVLIAGGALIYFGVDKSALLIYCFIGSLLHFSAKDEFKKVISALCSRWAGAADVNRGPAQTTVVTQTLDKDKVKDTPQ